MTAAAGGSGSLGSTGSSGLPGREGAGGAGSTGPPGGAGSPGPEAAGVPLLVRLAGLSAGVLVPFGDAGLLVRLDEIEELQPRLGELRAAAVARLFGQLPQAGADERRFLLGIKRDCHNGRPLGNHRQHERWAWAVARTGGVLEEIAALEDDLAARQEGFRQSYAAVAERELQALAGPFASPWLRRGLALATPDLVEALERRRERPFHGHRARRLEASLLRYLSRAACKLSPYSTLTPLALACVVEAGDVGAGGGAGGVGDGEQGGGGGAVDSGGPGACSSGSAATTATAAAGAGAGEQRGGGGARGVPAAVRYVAGPRRDRSLVRVKRYLLDQCCRLLFLHPPILDHLGVGLNSSLEILGAGSAGEAAAPSTRGASATPAAPVTPATRATPGAAAAADLAALATRTEYRFLRPPQLGRGEEGGEAVPRLVKTPPAQVKVRLGGELVGFVRQRLAGTGVATFRALAEAAAVQLGDGGAADREVAARGLRQLLDLGFLEVRPPWPGYEPHLEVRLLELLDSLEGEAALPAVRAVLHELLELELGYATAADPVAAVHRIDDLVRALYDAIGAAVEPAGHQPLQRTASRSYYEDVFVAPRDADRPFLLELDRAALRRALDAGDLIWRLGHLFEPRHEVLLALDHHLAERHPGRESLPVAELFAETRPLWSAYRRHVDERRPGPFDPHGLPAIAALEALRGAVRHGLAAAVEIEAGVERLDLGALRELAAEMPRRFLPPTGCCLFLEPGDRRGSTWVANARCEGTGRMSCRYNVVLDAASRELYVRHFTARSVFERDGERLELVDLLFTRGNTVNLHWPQTRRVLQTPGEAVDLPAERVLRLADLAVERRAGAAPRLLAAGGGRIVPCFLTPLDVAFLPAVLRFLALFGSQPEGGLPLPEAVEAGDGWTRVRRRMVGNVVIGRQRWTIDAARLPALAGGAAAFAELHRWRRRLGLPEQVFLLERQGADAAVGEVWKPQYLDLRSPAFVSLLAGAIERGLGTVRLVEALPRPEDFPLDPEAGPRAFEVILEAPALD